MPLFTYECKDCEKIFELFIRNNEEPICPNCQSKILEKYIGHSSFILKGFGWAKHGYADKPSTPIESDDGRAKILTRIPQYSDRNTGRKLGSGTPQTIITND